MSEQLPPLIGLSSATMGSGKTTIAKALVDLGFTRIRFAEPLKRATSAILQAAGVDPALIPDFVDGELKETPIPLFGGRTPRHMMQTLGTEWGRELISPTLWVDLAMTEVRRLRAAGHPVVMDDVRFPNEAMAIWDEGGLMVRVERPVRDQLAEKTAHASEGGLNGTPHDLVVQNIEGLDRVPHIARRIALFADPDMLTPEHAYGRSLAI